jgi:hypothetical protein
LSRRWYQRSWSLVRSRSSAWRELCSHTLSTTTPEHVLPERLGKKATRWARQGRHHGINRQHHHAVTTPQLVQLQVIGSSLSFTLVPKDMHSLDEAPEPEPPFHAKCIPRHDALKSHIVHWIDGANYPGPPQFQLANSARPLTRMSIGGQSSLTQAERTSILPLGERLGVSHFSGLLVSHIGHRPLSLSGARHLRGRQRVPGGVVHQPHVGGAVTQRHHQTRAPPVGRARTARALARGCDHQRASPP